MDQWMRFLIVPIDPSVQSWIIEKNGLIYQFWKAYGQQQKVLKKEEELG